MSVINILVSTNFSIAHTESLCVTTLLKQNSNVLKASHKRIPSQWETSLQSNAVSHWLGTTLESALLLYFIMQNQTFEANHITTIVINSPPGRSWGILWTSNCMPKLYGCYCMAEYWEGSHDYCPTWHVTTYQRLIYPWPNHGNTMDT